MIKVVILNLFFLFYAGTVFAETFTINEPMKDRVGFWIDVYAKYNSWEMAVHNVEKPHIVYEVLNNKDLFDNKKLSERRRRYLIGRRYRKAKAKYQRILRKLHVNREKIASNTGELTTEEQRVANLFKNVADTEKFQKAARRRSIRGQSGLRDQFRVGIFHSGRYVPKIIEIFNEMGVPKQLAYLPFVESGFNHFALSKVGASGMWQFMPSTGRFYLRVDDIVDERNDPFYAARAAGKLLLKNFETLEEWSLAITAYNHGRAGMKRAVRTVGSKQIHEIIKKYNGPAFGFASSNFYACFLAAVHVVQNRGEFFGKVELSKPLDFDMFIVPDFININKLANYLEIEIDVLKELNPGLQKSVYNGEKLVPVGYALRVPKMDQKKLLTNYENIPKEYKFSYQIEEANGDNGNGRNIASE